MNDYVSCGLRENVENEHNNISHPLSKLERRHNRCLNTLNMENK